MFTLHLFTKPRLTRVGERSVNLSDIHDTIVTRFRTARGHTACVQETQRFHLSDSPVKAICQLCKTSGLAARYVTSNRKKMPVK